MYTIGPINYGPPFCDRRESGRTLGVLIKLGRKGDLMYVKTTTTTTTTTTTISSSICPWWGHHLPCHYPVDGYMERTVQCEEHNHIRRGDTQMEQGTPVRSNVYTEYGIVRGAHLIIQPGNL